MNIILLWIVESRDAYLSHFVSKHKWIFSFIIIFFSIWSYFSSQTKKIRLFEERNKKKASNRASTNVLMWLLTSLFYVASDVEDLCSTTTRIWHFKSKICVFLFRSHSAEKSEIERKRMWMWFLEFLFNAERDNKILCERIFRISCLSWNACMYCFCYSLSYSKKAQNRTNAYIVFFVERKFKIV
jgi:hypothetical protein